jgi:hypothetical protein
MRILMSMRIRIQRFEDLVKKIVKFTANQKSEKNLSFDQEEHIYP